MRTTARTTCGMLLMPCCAVGTVGSMLGKEIYLFDVGVMGIEALPGPVSETDGIGGSFSVLTVSQYVANPFQQEYAALHFAKLRFTVAP